MGGRANASWEGLGSDDEGRGVGTEIEEELEESEASKERALAKMVNFTGEDAKEEGRHGETHELESLTTDDINGEKGEVVTGKETESRDDDISGSDGKKFVIYISSSSTITDVSKHDALVQVDTIKCNVDEEPAESSTEEDLQMGPGREVVDELLVMGLLDSDDTVPVVIFLVNGGNFGAGVRVDLLRVLRSVLLSFLVIMLERGFGARSLGKLILAGLRKSEASIESSDSGDQGETNEDAPDLVSVLDIASLEIRLEGTKGNDGDEGADEGAPSLVCKDKAQERASAMNVGTIGNDGGAHRIVTTDSDSEEDTGDEDPGENLITSEVRGD